MSSSHFYSVTMGFMILVAIIVLGLKHKQANPNQNRVNSKAAQAELRQMDGGARAQPAEAAPETSKGGRDNNDPTAQLMSRSRQSNAAPVIATPAVRSFQQQGAARSRISNGSQMRGAGKGAAPARSNTYGAKNR